MRINNKSITGLFIYSKDAIYERNDMVIVDNTIYVCFPKGSESVRGEDPTKSENFYIYLNDRTISQEEYQDILCISEKEKRYKKFLETSEGENSVVDVATLQGILNHFMIGIDSKGIIGDCIELTRNGTYRVIVNGKEYSDSITDYNNILSTIFMDDNINNAIFRVSNNLPELEIYGVGKYCILKQYTTIREIEHVERKVRIQELIDPDSGLIYLRYLILGENNSPGEFKCSVINAYHIKEQIDKILEVYTSRLNYLQVLEENLKDNFRYRQLLRDDITSYSITINLSDPTDTETYFVGPTDFITVLLKKKLSDLNEDLVYESESVSISLKESLNQSYLIFDGEYKLILTLSPDKTKLTISTNDDENKITISEITYREYYGN